MTMPFLESSSRVIFRGDAGLGDLFTHFSHSSFKDLMSAHDSGFVFLFLLLPVWKKSLVG